MMEHLVSIFLVDFFGRSSLAMSVARGVLAIYWTQLTRAPCAAEINCRSWPKCLMLYYHTIRTLHHGIMCCSNDDDDDDAQFNS